MKLTRQLKLIKPPQMRGDDVRQVQTWLKTFGFDCGKIDSVYGTRTESAVIAYQKSRKLKVDGVVGNQTWDSLRKENTVIATPPTTDNKNNGLVTCSTLINVRKSRSVTSSRIGQLKNGDKVTILDSKLDQNYAKIEFNGGIGYAYSKKGAYLKFVSVPSSAPTPTPQPISTPDIPIIETEIDKKIKNHLDIVSSCVGGKYVIGGQGHKITTKYINSRAKARPTFFTNGRKEFLLAIAKRCEESGIWNFPEDYCWDCSGLFWYSDNQEDLFVGLKDSTADRLFKTHCVEIKKNELRAGDCTFYIDFTGKATHMGIVGYDGVIYEAMSGYVGVVKLDNVEVRSAPKIVGSGTLRRSAWNRFGRPKCFAD